MRWAVSNNPQPLTPQPWVHDKWWKWMDGWMSWGNVCRDSCLSNKKEDFSFLHSSHSATVCSCFFFGLPAKFFFFTSSVSLWICPPPHFPPFLPLASFCTSFPLVLSLLWNSFAHHPTPLPTSTTSSPSPPPHCCIIQSECYLEWLVLSLSTSPLVALRAFNPFPAPEKTPTTTHKRLDSAPGNIHEFIYIHLPCVFRYSQTNAKQFSHLPCHECSSSLFPFLSTPNTSRGGPQRSLKQQLQADAGPDYNRTRRLLFITTSSTEPKHFCREPRLYITEQGHCSSEDKKKRERDIRGNMPLQFITYKRSEEWVETQRDSKKMQSCFKKVACNFLVRSSQWRSGGIKYDSGTGRKNYSRNE